MLNWRYSWLLSYKKHILFFTINIQLSNTTFLKKDNIAVTKRKANCYLWTVKLNQCFQIFQYFCIKEYKVKLHIVKYYIYYKKTIIQHGRIIPMTAAFCFLFRRLNFSERSLAMARGLFTFTCFLYCLIDGESIYAIIFQFKFT